MDVIAIRGARENNLQGLDLDLPKGKVILLTGPSGSGKSSLAFHTLHAEGQRRYQEAISPQLRTALAQRPRVAVDSLTGLPPTLAVAQQASGSPHPKATLGTLTDIGDLLCVLFARCGTQHCPDCNAPLSHRAEGEIVAELNAIAPDTRLLILAPVLDQGDARGLVADLQGSGFVRARIDGEVVRLEEVTGLDASPRDVAVVIDRIRTGPDKADRIADAARLALRAGRGRLLAVVGDQERALSEIGWCGDCRLSVPRPTPARLSHLSHGGACPDCQGLGRVGPEDIEGSCGSCEGTRLGPAARAVQLAGVPLPEANGRSVQEVAAFLKTVPRGPVADLLVESLERRLELLNELGLGYLGLDRAAKSLSTGELQRARIAAVGGARLSGVLYVLDEPSAGLHPDDLPRLSAVLHRLREEGNTVVVVDHDSQLLAGADLCLDFGPGAGDGGGQLVYSGSPEGLKEAPTLTGRWLSGAETLPPHSPRRIHRSLTLEKATGHNLQGVTLKLPLRALTVVTGPSGAGKSSLVFDTLLPALQEAPGLPHGGLTGADPITRIAAVDARPIGNSPRSTPATYTQLWGRFRTLFSATKEARIRGFDASHFALGNKGGRCEACRGLGVQRIQLEWLPEVHLPCEICGGRRFDEATLSIRFRDCDLADVLAMTVSDARHHFAGIAPLEPGLAALEEIGLGYLPLGRPTPSLSGGEAQRLKLARALGRGTLEGALFLLDEPCVGLHPADVARLCRVLHGLVDKGATVLVIEHDPMLVGQADRVVEMGPGAGPEGGRIL
jgi:excinuclease ABC subunit A